jgi:rRNA processing protein Gar1
LVGLWGDISPGHIANVKRLSPRGIFVQKLGKIENITDDGNFLVKAGSAPRPGTRVFNGRNQPLGRVSTIIGPVRAPYLVVKPRDVKTALSQVGKEAYMR